MNYEIVKKVVKRNKGEYEFVGTCFFIDKKIAFTAKHVIKKPGELYIEYSLDKHVKFEIDADSEHDIALLLVKEEIECKEYCIPDITKLLQGEDWVTYGYPNTKLEGESITGYVSIPDTSVGELYDIDLRMNDNPDLRNYSGLSGSPVFIDESVKAILVWKPDGNSFGGVKISNCKGLLDKWSINYKENYSSWINKVTDIGLKNDEKFLIERTTLMSNLEEFTLGGHGLVIGNPGSGKTYSLKQLHNILNGKGITSLYIAIDNFTSVSNHEFEEEFNLKTGDNLISKLEQELTRIQNDNSKAVIIFDSFDSARDESVKHKFLVLMKRMKETIGDKVNIIASCRSYDARISTNLQEIFPKSHDVSSRIHCRHFIINELSEIEVLSVLGQIGISEYQCALLSNELRNLLKTPFNLWLFEQCREGVESLEEFGGLTSEIQLLDLFWDKRISGNQAESVELVLSEITDVMLKNKSLSVKKREVFKSGYQVEWGILLSNAIIKYSSKLRNKIAFSHNILFDYAVAKLILVDQLEDFISFIEKDISRVIFMRASLMYFLNSVWLHERDEFWSITFNVMASKKLPTISKLILIHIITIHATKDEDLEILLKKLDERDENVKSLIKYLLQAISIFKVFYKTIWINFVCELYERIDDDLLGVLAYDILEIATNAANNSNVYTIKKCGLVSRAIYKKYRDEIESNVWIRSIINGAILPSICITVSTDIEESSVIFRDIVDNITASGNNVDLTNTICRNIASVFKGDFNITDYIYQKVVLSDVSSTEKTSMNISRILNLTSNKKQDFDMCKHYLYSDIDKLIDYDIDNGILLALRTLNSISLSMRSVKHNNIIEVKIDNSMLSIVEDGSEHWASVRFNEEIKKYGDAIINHLRKLTSNENNKIESFIDLLIKEAKCSYIWSLVLRNVDCRLSYLIDKLVKLCLNTKVLLSRSLTYSIRTFLKNCSSCFNHTQIEAIERAIHSLNEEGEYAKMLIKDLILSIDKELLLMEESIGLRHSIDGRYEIKPDVQYSLCNYKESYEDKLCRIGIDINMNISLIKKMEELAITNDLLTNKNDCYISLDKIMSQVMSLYNELLIQKCHEVLEKEILKLIACGFKNALVLDKNVELMYLEDYKQIINYIINTKYFLENEKGFISRYSGYVSTPKHVVAEKIGLIINYSDDDQIFEKYKMLEAQISGSAKCTLIDNIYQLHEKKREFMWEKLKFYAYQEELFYSESVISCLWHLLGSYEGKVLEILHVLVGSNAERIEVINKAIGLVMYFYINGEDEQISEILRRISTNPSLYEWSGQNGISATLIELIKYDNLQEVQNEVINKVIEFLDVTLKNLVVFIETQNKKINENPDDKKLSEELKENYSVFDRIITSLYCKSGALEKNRSENQLDLERLYYFTIKPLIKTVLNAIEESEDLYITPSTIHRFVQMLNHQINFDTVQIIEFISILIVNGKKVGYLGDSLAINEIVKLMEKLFADHKYTIQEEEVLSNVLLILDSFAEIGSDKAVNFIWRLEEIFR